VGLAQALIHEPDILILDEPTSGLDPNQIIEIRELIKRIGREKTVILCTHILPEVTTTCDRAIIINQGRIVADGTPDELVRKAQRGTTIVARIRGPQAAVHEKLSAFPQIKSITASEAGPNDLTRYEMTVAEDVDLGEDIFQMVVANGWTLSELSRETASLEEVFAQLTKAEK
ncbi:MAG: ABC transporter, partial [Candidatus Sumerlaeia bacterium]|nr:ABC transporter [Candidatus Sumerlaeia bacterium]